MWYSAHESEERDNKDPLPQKVVVHYTWHNECDKKAYQIHHFSAPIKTLMSRVHISVMSVIKKHFECIIWVNILKKLMSRLHVSAMS